MIQGQFDAATKVDVSKTQDFTADVGREPAERPRKRRKTSPIEDSINVVDLGSQGPKSADQQEIIVTAKPGDEQVSLAQLTEAGAVSPSRDRTLSQPIVQTEQNDTKPNVEDQGTPILNSEQTPVSGDSNSGPDLPFSNITVRTATSRTGIEAPGPPASRSQSPRVNERLFRLSNGSNILQSLSSGRNPSSGPSTPKAPRSGAQTLTNSSSPLSSPPPELFDPYDEQSTEPPPSSSRPSSPVSDDEERCISSSSDEGGLAQERVNRSQTLRRSLSTLKGRELFDASIWADPLKTSVFYTFATNLRQKSKDAAPTGCHEFISHLASAGKMVRCYTQNIDLLEDKVGLSTRLLLGPGSRSRFSTRLSKAAGTATPRTSNVASNPPSNGGDGPCTPSQTTTVSEPAVLKEESKPPDATTPSNSQPNPSGLETHAEPSQQEEKSEEKPSRPETTDRGVECVFLHGSLRSLRCFQCGCVADWDEANREHLTLSGEQPPCPRCEDATAARQERGKRALGVGKLRPDIVLYGEEHPESQRISTIIQHDISLAPDMLIIMGTSLKVHGLKTVVREFAKAVHNKKDGKVIFINFTKPAESVWADIIDYWIEMDCDAWVQDLKEKKPIIWLPPGSIDEEPRSTKRRRTIKDETDKQSKKMKNGEQPKDASDKDDKKKSSKSVLKENLTDAKKPEPKRPAAFRDCKHNAAYWTIKIMSELAKLVGRKEKPFQMPRPSNPASILEKSVPTPPVKVRRGPRTKNTKSRKMLDNSSALPKARRKLAGKAIIPTELGAGEASASTSTVPSDDCKVPPSPKMPKAKSSSGSGATENRLDQTSSATILVEVPIPNMAVETDIVGPGTSILASVKSNHRIRKPKKIFGEPESEAPSAPSGAKSKPKNAPLAKKPKATAKSHNGKEKQTAETNGSNAIYASETAHTLPAPPTQLHAISAASELQTTQYKEALVQSCYILPPLRHDSIQRQPKHNLPALDIDVGSSSGPNTTHPPPAILEPIIVPGPPIAMSPSMMSPDHWRNRAFTFSDSLSRHFENQYPQSHPPPNTQNALMQPSMPRYMDGPYYPDRQYTVSDLTPPGPTSSSVDDSPSQQLHRESREKEAAAAALNELRQTAYDSRHFAIKPEVP